MFYLILQTALLILAAFVLGAICGCLLHRLFGRGGRPSTAVASDLVASAAPEAIKKPKRKTPAESAAEAVTATVVATTASMVATEEKAVESVADPVELPPTPAEEMDEAAVEAAIAALPADASNEDKANAVGVRPRALDAPTGGEKDNLQRIKGIGKVNEGKLNDLGIYHFSQIKDWSPSEARWVGTYLSFSGRIEREDWIGQATTLASGGETEFAKRVDKGKVSSSSSKKKSKKKQ